MSVDVELIGGARDGEITPMRELRAFLVDGRWHLYEREHKGGGVLQYVGVVDETPAADMTAGDE